MSAYYAYIDDVVVGPYSQLEMCALLRSGKARQDTMVEQVDTEEWHPLSYYAEIVSPQGSPAGVLDGLFERLDGSEVVFRCPSCMQKYRVERTSSADARIYCKNCKRLVRIPSVDTSVPPPVATKEASSDTSLPPPVANKEVSSQPSSLFDDGEILEGDLTCPHCWRSFGEESLLYISVHPMLVGDPVVGEFEPRRFRPSVYNQLGQPLDDNGLPATEMACPCCHLRFPEGMIDSHSLYFSIAGATSSGKSYFLTTQTHVLRDVLLRQFDASFFDLDPRLNETLTHYENQLFMPLDASKITALPATQISGEGISDKIRLDGVDIELPKPFIFEFCVKGKAQTRRNLVFYDNSGELFIPGRDEWVNQATRHLSHSNGITFLFDPTNDSRMLRQICNPADPQVSKRPRVVDQTLLLTELISRIRRHANLQATETCDIPLVIAVCKYDVWREAFKKELGSPYLIENDETVLDMNKILDVSFALRELLQEYVPALVNTAESFFKRVTFVPVSAFGTLAELDESGYIGVVSEKINPIWVEVPFMVIMKENGELPGRIVKGNGAAEIGFKTHVDDERVHFRHPVTQEKVSLPKNYMGARLTIAGKLYDLPGDRNAEMDGTRKSVWF